MNKDRKKLWRQFLGEFGNGNVTTTIELGLGYLKSYPEDGPAWIIMGEMYTLIAKYDDALFALRRASKLAPKKRLDMVYVRLGNLYRAKGNYKIAEKWFRKAIKLNPKSTENNILLGALLAKMGNFKEAKKYHGKAARMKRDTWDEAHHNLGLIYRAEGKYKLALRHFNKAIEIDPQYCDAIEERTDVLNAIKIKKGR